MIVAMAEDLMDQLNKSKSYFSLSILDFSPVAALVWRNWELMHCWHWPAEATAHELLCLSLF